MSLNAKEWAQLVSGIAVLCFLGGLLVWGLFGALVMFVELDFYWPYSWFGVRYWFFNSVVIAIVLPGSLAHK